MKQGKLILSKKCSNDIDKILYSIVFGHKQFIEIDHIFEKLEQWISFESLWLKQTLSKDNSNGLD